MPTDLPNFMEAVRLLGTTQEQRAKKLGCSPRNLNKWFAEGPPVQYRRLVRHPDLVAALLADAKQARSEEPN